MITLPMAFYFDHDLKVVNAVCLPNQFGKIDELSDSDKLTITGFGEINEEEHHHEKLQFVAYSMNVWFKMLKIMNI